MNSFIGKKSAKTLVGFLGDLKTSKIHSEIKWPLAQWSQGLYEISISNHMPKQFHEFFFTIFNEILGKKRMKLQMNKNKNINSYRNFGFIVLGSWWQLGQKRNFCSSQKTSPLLIIQNWNNLEQNGTWFELDWTVRLPTTLKVQLGIQYSDWLQDCDY